MFPGSVFFAGGSLEESPQPKLRSPAAAIAQGCAVRTQPSRALMDFTNLECPGQVAAAQGLSSSRFCRRVLPLIAPLVVVDHVENVLAFNAAAPADTESRRRRSSTG